jgi:hypothetical protein
MAAVRRVLARLVWLRLGACCTTEVLPVGPDTYRVGGIASNSLGGYATAEAEALKRANE